MDSHFRYRLGLEHIGLSRLYMMADAALEVIAVQ